MRNWLDVADTVLILLSTLILYITLVRTLKLTKDTKAADVAVFCQKRYEDLVVSAATARDADPRIYFGRFWSLQLDQYQLWRAGFILNPIFLYWMACRNREWKRDEEYRGMSYRAGWNFARRLIREEEFERFMDRVFALSLVDKCAITEALDHSLRG